MTSTFSPYITSDEIQSVVRRFEDCDFGPGEFHHSDHVTVVMCYLLECSEKEACARMRVGLMHFLNYHGSPNAFHETITVFWVKFVKRLIVRAGISQPFIELANEVVSGCRNPRLIDDYYGAELLASEEARRSWLEPDLRSLESFSARNQ